MNLLAEVLLIIFFFFLGYRLNYIERKSKKLYKVYVKNRTEAKKSPEEKEAEKSSLIDLDDPVVAARLEHEEMMRKLNPHIHDDEMS